MMPNARRMRLAAAILPFLLIQAGLAQTSWKVASPDGQTTIAVKLTAPGHVADYASETVRLYYEVAYHGRTVLPLSPLGIARHGQRFDNHLAFVAAGPSKTIDETYTMLHGKRRLCRDHATEQTLTFRNPDGAQLELILRAYDDGVAFRYRFPEQSEAKHIVTGEMTGFALPADGKIWAHPYDKSTEYSPAYETHYVNGIPVGTASSNEAGWAFPLLFCTADGTRWGLLTEAGLDRSYCGSRLQQEAPQGVYRMRFADEAEGNFTGSVEPSWTLPWATPWRVIMLGETVGQIVESTLVTNLNPPSVVKDTSWIKPGRVSWSWLFDHDSPQDCAKLKPFVDLAAEMGWEYSLVDANWNIMKNGTIHDLLAYANDKGVKLLLWYNSGGPHNYVSEQPRGTMFYRSIRRKEFKRLQDWGVKGVKVDFFQSDKQNVIQLYQDILQDAADFQIMVNFHGCTLPRGWSRTYPHLMSMESVRGEECYSFEREFTTKAPVHNVITPFTRNVVGPMDYTPVMFGDNVYPHLTTNTHELALSIVFESGWLHFADGVDAYLGLPEAPKAFLKNVPVVWDQTRFLDGRPGQFIVLARRHGKQWYIGGINGENASRNVGLSLSLLDQGRYDMTLIRDGAGPRDFSSRTRTVGAADEIEVRMSPYGGFVAVLTPAR